MLRDLKSLILSAFKRPRTDASESARVPSPPSGEAAAESFTSTGDAGRREIAAVKDELSPLQPMSKRVRDDGPLAAPAPLLPDDPDPTKPWLAFFCADEKNFSNWDEDLKDGTDFLRLVDVPSRGWVDPGFSTIKGSGSVARGFEFTVAKHNQAPFVFQTPAGSRPTNENFKFTVAKGDPSVLDLSKGWKLERPNTLFHPMLCTPPTPSQETTHEEIKGRLPKGIRLVKVPPTGWLPWYHVEVIVAMLVGLFGYDPAGRAPLPDPLPVAKKVDVRNLIEFVDGKYRPNNLPSEDVVFHKKTQDIYLFGVADGHTGRKVAQYFADLAPGIFKSKVLALLPSASQPQERANALLDIVSDIIAQVDAHALANFEINRCRDENAQTEIYGGDSGAVVALVALDTVLGGMAVANVGDCSVSIVSKIMPGEADFCPATNRFLIEKITKDHSCEDGFEGARVMLAGGFFSNRYCRIGGHLLPSRVVGDFSVRELDKTVGASMSPAPDLRWVPLSPSDVGIALVSDGCSIPRIDSQRSFFNPNNYFSSFGSVHTFFDEMDNTNRELSDAEKAEKGKEFAFNLDSHNFDDHGLLYAQIFVEPCVPNF